jgi:alpha-galactosidase
MASKSTFLAGAMFAAASLLTACNGSIEDPGVLPTPPMGFNNWARFECDLNETLFTETADAMVSRGLRAAGYNRLNLDDCWMSYNRTSDGLLTWNTTKFPHGVPWLAEYVKTHGNFHLGIYEDSGNLTCGGYPGSYGYEEADAKTFASWGIDYLKLDGCNVDPSTEPEYKARYGLWHQVFSKMAQPLIFSESAPAYFSASSVGDSTNVTDWYTVMDWVPVYGELARHSTDVLVYVGEGSAWNSIMNNYDFNSLVARYQAPGYYNDPDFLIADHQGLTLDEKRSHFALWASFSAPLIISAYIPALPEEVISYLTNKELIAVDQDGLAEQATLVSRDPHFDVLTRSLANGDRLLTVLNRGDNAASTTISTARLGLEAECSYIAKDLWNGAPVKINQGKIEIKNLASHATLVYRISLPKHCNTVTPTGMIFNTQSTRCVTASGNEISFANCTGTDSQTWQVTPAGAIKPLSDAGSCLKAEGKSIVLAECNNGKDDLWTYSITGNLKSAASGVCLTEGPKTAGACGFELDSQVWALPAGVSVEGRESYV